MLAAPSPAHSKPMAEQLTVNPLTAIENRLCPGCKKSAVNEGGGLVVAFGQSFFHVDCFKCAKCYQQVTADTNLLLLSDGSPVCADCSYNCNICQQPILDEAIMTGDDSYHAHCFKCKVCHNRIDELVFAKTSHGIYCMNCHNERMAKIRRHAQRKREKEKAAGGSGSSSTREREAREFLGENGVLDQSQTLSPPSSLRSRPSIRALRDTPPTTSTNPSIRDPMSMTPVRKRKSFSPLDETPRSAPTKPPENVQRQSSSSSQSQSRSSDGGQPHSFSVTIAPPDASHDGDNDRTIVLNGNPPAIRSAPAQSNGLSQGDSVTSLGYLQSASPEGTSLLSPLSAAGAIGTRQRRKSYDDGVRPLNVLFGGKDTNQNSNDATGQPVSTSLNIPNGSTSRSEKRRSINPGLTLDYDNAPRTSTSSDLTAPEMIRSQTLPVQRSDSPATLSPSNELFGVSGSWRTSNTSLLRDNASVSTVYHSPSSSPAPLDNGRATPDSTRLRSISHDPNHPYSAPPFPRPNSPLRPAPRPSLTLERVPQRSDSLTNEAQSSQSANGRLSPVAPSHRVPGSRSGDVSSSSVFNSDTSRMPTPTSPSHVADVPHNIESGTDTEAEGDSGRKSNDHFNDNAHTKASSKPVRPAKGRYRPGNLKLDIDPDVSAVSHLDGSDESSPVERTSIATFIAPALPPIRFSMSGADFSDFLKSVGGIPSLKSLDKIAQGEEPVEMPMVPENDRTPTATAGTTLNFGGAAPAPNDASVPEKISTADAKEPPTVPRNEAPSLDAEAKDVVPSLSRTFSSRERAASESQSSSIYGHGMGKRERLDSNASLNIVPSTTRSTVVSSNAKSPPPPPGDSYDFVVRRLQESLADANERGAQHMKFDKALVEAILVSMEQKRVEYTNLKAKYDGTKRASQQYMDGLTDAQKEYERELVARQNAEAEVIRLRVLLSGQAARLTALSGENNRQEARRQLSQELSRSLDQLERDLSKLRAERDVTLAEVEELCSSKSTSSVANSGEVPAAHLSRSLTMRLDNIKAQYQLELVPLTQQREALVREIAELKAAREQCLEETTVLNARNEELAQLSAQYTRRMEASRSETPTGPVPPTRESSDQSFVEKKSTSLDRNRSPHPEPPASIQHSISTGSVPSITTLVEDRDIKATRLPKAEFVDAMSTLKHGKFKWPGSRTRETSVGSLDPRGRGREHNFQQASVLRFTRCDHCGDKLWGGSHFRCTTCHINVHSRCVNQVHLVCSQQPSRPRDESNGQLVQPPSSMFGRDLVEQVKSDSRWGERKVPVIVEKCIDAVETTALDYEGIYRKTGGAGQTKVITQLFERGDYAAFDLRDSNRFNDICSVTSVLKTYFRSLPVPLLTFDLHGEFISAAGLKDPALKTMHLQELVDRLPSEHYHTLRLLMLHLHRVREHSNTNLMNARNLGVVFGPTLMWSRDPGSEFSDMAGKALMVEWLVENAVSIFQTQPQLSPR